MELLLTALKNCKGNPAKPISSIAQAWPAALVESINRAVHRPVYAKEPHADGVDLQFSTPTLQ